MIPYQRWVSIMEEAMQRLRNSLQSAPVIWKGDYPYFIHPLTDGVPRLDPEVLSAVTDLCLEAINWQDVDLILGIEAMGLPLTAPLSINSGKPLVVVRKRQYGLEGEVAIDQSTGYSKGEMYLNDIKSGERIVIVDDVLSTGGTIRAIINGIEKTGAKIMHIITVIEKGPGLKILQKEFPNIKIESLVRLEMDGADIVILD